MFGNTALQIIQQSRIRLETKLDPSRNCVESSTGRSFDQLVLNSENMGAWRASTLGPVSADQLLLNFLESQWPVCVYGLQCRPQSVRLRKLSISSACGSDLS